MGMREIHDAALGSSNVAYHLFLLNYKVSEQIVYGFVEGKDDPSFYRGFIESSIPDDWDVELISSNNKAKVLTIFDIMDWSRYPKKRVCFFVDRDLSEFLSDVTRSGENLYVTDNYSIENEVVNFKTMERVLDEVLGVTDLNPTEFELIRDLFESNQEAFSEAMAPVMAQILLWKRAGANVSLNNIKPKDFFIFEKGEIGLKPSFNSPEKRVLHAASRVGAPQDGDKEIADAEAEFRGKQGLEKYIRGKYLLWFFVQCAKEIHKATPDIRENYKAAPKVHIELSVKNAIVVIAPRVRCPASLKLFLEYNYDIYIREMASAV